MKRTVFFIAAIVTMVIAAFFVSKRISKNEEQPLRREVLKKGSRSSEARKLKGEILNRLEWHKALLGEWDITDTEHNESSLREIIGDIEFLKNGTFKLGYAYKRYDLTEFIVEGIQKRIPATTEGGNLQGKWQIIDGYIQFSDVKVDIATNANAGVSSEKEFKPNEYYEGFKLGNVKDREKTTILLFNRHHILIEGRRYATGSDISYELIRTAEPEDNTTQARQAKYMY